MSNTEIYKSVTERSLEKITVTTNEQIINNENEIQTNPLNNFTINDIIEETNLKNNFLSSDSSNIVGVVDVINYPITSFTSNINPPLSLVSPSTVEGRFTNIDGIYRGTIRVSDLFYNTIGTQQTFTIDMSPIKSINFITEDQVCGMASIQSSNIQLRGNIRAVPGTTNILVQLYSNAAIQGILILNMIFN